MAGRKPLKEDELIISLSFRIPESELERFRLISDQLEQNRSALIREWVENYCNKYSDYVSKQIGEPVDTLAEHITSERKQERLKQEQEQEETIATP